MILAIPRCMSQHVMIITILHFNLLVVFVLQDASPHFKSNQEFFAFSKAQRQKALWNHQPSWWFSFIQEKARESGLDKTEARKREAFESRLFISKRDAQRIREHRGEFLLPHRRGDRASRTCRCTSQNRLR